MRTCTGNAFIIALILSFTFLFGAAAASDPLSVTRDLPASVLLGDTFDVTLSVDVNDTTKPKSYILYETIPVGFDIISTGGMQYTPSTRTFKLMVFESSYYKTTVEDRTIAYRLKYVALHENPFVGYVRYNFENHETTGDTNFVGEVDEIPPAVAITSPLNKTYDIKTLSVIVSTDETAEEITESIDGSAPDLLCTYCNYNEQIITFSNGYHEITIYAKDTSSNTGAATVGFTVNYCEPNWVLNATWSECINDTQSKNYYDINNCNKPDEKPSDRTRTCSLLPPPIYVYRILPENVSAGEEFDTVLNVEVNETRKPNSYVLYETIPSGFDMVSTGGMQYTPSTRTLKLMVFESAYFKTHVEDRNITYRLKPLAHPQDIFRGYIRLNNEDHDTKGANSTAVSGII